MTFDSSGQLRFRLSEEANNGQRFEYDVSASGVVASPQQWLHFAVSWDLNREFIGLYADGQLIGQFNNLSPLNQHNLAELLTLVIGDESDDQLLSAEIAGGLIDEFRVYDTALSTEAIGLVRDATQPCPVDDAVDHYRISHDGIGLLCEAEPILISAHEQDGTPIAPGAGTQITLTALDNGQAKGRWTNVIFGNGSLALSGAAGEATYTFAEDETQVIIGYGLTEATTVNFDINAGSTPNENPDFDPDIRFREAEIRFFNAQREPLLIGTQISGKPSDVEFGAQEIFVDVVGSALDLPSGTGRSLGRSAARDGDEDRRIPVCRSLLNNDELQVGFASRCLEPASCQVGSRLSINSVPVANPQNGGGLTQVNLVPNRSGLAPVVLNYPDAGRIQIDAQMDAVIVSGSAEVTVASGQSNPFVVRPFSLSVEEIASDQGDNPSGSATAGDGFAEAGESFEHRVVPRQWRAGQDSVDGVLDGSPGPDADVSGNGLVRNYEATAVLTAALDSPNGGNLGVLGVGQVALERSGRTLVDTQSYSEVGSIHLQANSGDYLGTGRVLGTLSEVVGRFFPASLVIDNSQAIIPTCNNFTYFGQELAGFEFTLQARNRNGDRVNNYGLPGYGVGSLVIDAENANDGNLVQVDVGSSLPEWQSGELVFSGIPVSLSRNGTPLEPLGSVQFSLRLAGDIDNLNLLNPDENATTTGNCSGAGCSSVGFGALQSFRDGRVSLTGASGSELEPLPVQLLTEYYLNGNWQPNTLDSCSVLSVADIDLDLDGDGSDAPPPGSLIVDFSDGNSSTGTFGGDDIANFINGDALFSFSAPGVEGTIFVDILEVPSWLRFDWDNDGNLDTGVPRVPVIFGRYQGHRRVIYWQEFYSE